jgi:uncharacterized phage protein gp47/JayE
MDPIENFNFIEGVNLDDSRFSDTEILEAQMVVSQYLEDRYKNLDFSPVSGLHDIVIRPMSQMYLICKNFIEEFSKTRTIFDALESGEDSKVVDAVLSNFLVERGKGKLSSGYVKISVEDYTVNQNVQEGSVFSTPDGLNFVAEKSTFATSDISSETDVQIFQNAGGSGYFLVRLVAQEAGAKFNLKKGTQLSTEASVLGLIGVTAVENFGGGEDKETSSSVFNRIISSLSHRGMSTPASVQQVLRDNFPSIITTSVHGITSSNMTRNANNIFGIKSGCMADVYVKTAAHPETRTVRLIAKRIEANNVEYESLKGNFLLRVDSSIFPGHYDVTSVVPYSTDKTIGSLPILSKVRKINNFHVSPNTYSRIEEVAFSAHQYTEVVFSAGSFGAGVDEIAVNCSIIGLPIIGEIQDFVNQPSGQAAMIDTLVRAFIPCFVSMDMISVGIKKHSLISQQLVEAEIASYISSLDLSSESLRVDKIVSVISSMDGVVGVDLPIKMSGRILLPTEKNESIDIVSYSELKIPDVLDKFVGKNTVSFFVSPGTIKINVRTVQ